MTDAPPNGGRWCCTGPGYVAECPLCPEYGTGLLEPCPGHEGSEANQKRVVEARLHAERRHPDFEYATTHGPRKQWNDPERPPAGENSDPDYTWQPNPDAGRPGQGWDRFDYHEEAYWRRPRERPTGPQDVDDTADIPADRNGPTIPNRQVKAGELVDNLAATLVVDPRQSAYDAVYAYIRSTNRMPGDLAYRNAMIWRAVNAALDAAGVPGRSNRAAVRELAVDLLDKGRDYTNSGIDSSECRTKAQGVIDASWAFAEAAGLPEDFDLRQIRDAAVEAAAEPKERHDDGPSIREAAANDRRWFDGERDGE